MSDGEKPGIMPLFLEHYDELRGFLRRWTGNPHRAAEVVQDLYLKLAAAPGNGEEIADPRAYFFRVARNLAIDAGRRDARRWRYLLPDGLSEAVADPAPSPEEAAASRARLALLDRALAELPDNVRRALLMSRVDGASHADIARRLGVSESMVAKYLARALRHCRDRVDRAEGKK